jgi:hypothetical protein
MTWGRRVWLAGGLVLVILGGVGLYLRHGRSEPASTPATKAVAKAIEPWLVGKHRVYTLELSSKISLPQGDLMALESNGRLEAVRLPGPKLDLALRYAPASTRLPTSPSDEAQVAAGMAQPFSARFDTSGLIEDVGFPEQARPEPSLALARGLLRSVVTALQVVGSSGAQKTWTSEEHDSVGVFGARYETLSALELLKTKTGYSRVTGTNPMMNARTELDIASGRLAFQALPFGTQTLKRVSWNETSRVVGDGPFPKLQSTFALTLMLASEEMISAEALAGLAAQAAGFKRSRLDDRSAENRMTVDHAKLGDTRFEDLLASIAKTDPKDQAAQARLFAMLKSHLRFDANSVAVAEKLIRQHNPQKSLLLDALGSAGSATAQEVLRQVAAEAGFTADDKRRAVIALSFVETPAQETLAFLRTLRSDPTYGLQALYGLGTAAYRLKNSDTQAAGGLALELAAELPASTDPSHTVDVLKAVGNAGNEATLDAIEPLLKDPNPAVRGAAVWALRLIPGDRADQGIAMGLRDPVATVRRDALEALSYRAPVPVLVYAVRESLQTEPDIVARREFVRAAMRFASSVPQLHAQLTSMASSDPDQRIREMLVKFAQG